MGRKNDDDDESQSQKKLEVVLFSGAFPAVSSEVNLAAPAKLQAPLIEPAVFTTCNQGVDPTP